MRAAAREGEEVVVRGRTRRLAFLAVTASVGDRPVARPHRRPADHGALAGGQPSLVTALGSIGPT